MEPSCGCRAYRGVGATDDLTDGELWLRASAGDSEAFAGVFERHREPVRAYCARRSGSLDAADDLVSIVFLEAWRRRADVELIYDSVLPWLYGVASRTVQRRTRTTLRHRRLLDRLNNHASVDSGGPAGHPVLANHADEVVARVDDERHLRQVTTALSRLGRLDQEVLLLCLWQELDHASASIALQVPVGTVKSRLSRARARLQRAARDDPGPPLDLCPQNTAPSPTRRRETIEETP